jgi:hypothetical protein
MTMASKQAELVMDELLHLYDWHVRIAERGEDDYNCGYADAIGQCILNIGKTLGESDDLSKPYKFEAYKRVMEYDTIENYWKEYPTPLANYFPAELIRKYGGKL